MDERTIARFRAKVDTSGEDFSCHEWTGARNASNYGLIRVDGRQQLAHRIAWEIAHGPIAAGMVIRHACDNPPCVKTTPDSKYPSGHLETGTPGDNNRDRFARKGYVRGEQHWAAKVSEDDVVEMQRLRREGQTYQQIAKRLGLSYTATHYILNGKTWSHLARATDLPKHVVVQRISPDAIETARRMRDDEHRPWKEIEIATGYGREYLQEKLPRRTGYNPNPAILAPDEADEAVRLRQDGMSWTRMSRHFENRISRMGLYYAWKNQMEWWREAEARVGPVEVRVALAKEQREKRMDRPYRRGTEHHNAKLNEEKVWLIRAKRLAGFSWAQIAEDMGLDRSTVSSAGKGRTWATAGPPIDLPAKVKGRRG